MDLCLSLSNNFVQYCGTNDLLAIIFKQYIDH